MFGGKEILDVLVNTFSGIDGADTRSHLDYSEKRPSPLMIIVAQDRCEQVNVGLPDYKLHFSILVDSLIADDADGEAFREVEEKVSRKIEEISDRSFNLDSIFGSLPVVGCFNSGSNESLTPESNRVVFGLDIITSGPDDK